MIGDRLKTLIGDFSGRRSGVFINPDKQQYLIQYSVKIEKRDRIPAK